VREWALTLDDYFANRTGLLLAAPYNDFLSNGGKLYPDVKAVAEAVGLIARYANCPNRLFARRKSAVPKPSVKRP
jgi:hypothetical protein